MDAESMIKAYLLEFSYSYAWYHYRKWTTEEAQRPGQAFFNALLPKDQSCLRGSIRDPFYKDDFSEIDEIIEWLIYN